MPTAERYARYRADQTTIWVSKTTAAFLSRERESSGEGAAAVLDRLLNELRRLRRGARKTAATPARAGAKTAAKGAAKTAKAAAKTTARGAAKATRKVAAKAKAPAKSAARGRPATKSAAARPLAGRVEPTQRRARRSA